MGCSNACRCRTSCSIADRYVTSCYAAGCRALYRYRTSCSNADFYVTSCCAAGCHATCRDKILSVASRFWCNFRVNSTILERPSLFPGLPVTVPESAHAPGTGQTVPGNCLSLSWDHLSPFLGACTVLGGRQRFLGRPRTIPGGHI